MSILFSNPSKVFCDFRSIDIHDFHYIVKFYEDTFESKFYIDREEELIMKYYYALSLFETNELNLFIKQADDILSHIFEHNISSIDGQDVFFGLLSKKSLALCQMGDHDNAIRFSAQLHRIYKNPRSYNVIKALLVKNSYLRRNKLCRRAAVIALSILMVSAIIMYFFLAIAATIQPVICLMGLIFFAGLFFKYNVLYKQQILMPLRQIDQNL